MSIQSKLIKGTNRYINSYDALYNAVSRKPLFNDEDWRNAANGGTLDIYANALLNSDSINYDQFREKYNLDYADSKTRMAALYNEVGADRQNVDTKRKRVINNEDGTTIDEEYLASDYQYNLELIRNQNDYYEQVRNQEVANDIKNSMDVGDHILSGAIGLGTGLISGILNGIENLVALSNAVIQTFSRKITDEKVTDFNVLSDKFVNAISDVKGGPLSQIVQDITNFETNYTSLRDANGNYTTLGKYIGGVFTSLGEMIPSMIIGYGAGRVAGAVGGNVGKVSSVVSQSSFYGGMAAGNIQDTYSQYLANGADIDSAAILANAGIKSTLQWAIEKGLGSILGTTSLDNMVFGRAQTGITSKTLTAAGLKNVFKDVVQEGLEEVLQDTSDFLVDQGFEYFIEGYKGTTDISWQSLLDAFIIGGIMSFAGSARSIITANKIIGADGKPLNKIAAWQYGLNSESFVESINEIEKRTKNNQMLSDRDKKAVRAATLEAYASYRMITSIYSEIGEERFKAADEVLSKITEKIKSGVFDVTTATEYVEKIKAQMTGISESALKKLAGDLQKGGVTEVKNTIKSDDKPVDNIEEKAVEILKSTGDDECKITDGNIVVSIDNKILIGKDKLSAKSVNELLENLSIKKLTNHLVDIFGNDKTFDFFTQNYISYYGSNPTNLDNVAVALLFDKDFFTSNLLTGNKNVYKILSYFVQLTKDVNVKTRADAVYKNKIKNAVKNWCDALTEYCILHNDAQPDSFLFAITDSKKRESIKKKIARERLSTVILQKVTDSNKNLSKLTPNEKRWLENKVYTLFIDGSADERWKLLNSSNLVDRIRTMNAIFNKLGTIYNKGYDGKTYLPDVSIGNRVFNNFIKRLGLTVSNVYKKEFLTMSDKRFILKEYGSVNADSVLKFRQEQFKRYTNNSYNFELVSGKIKVYSDNIYVGGSNLVKNTSYSLEEMTGISDVKTRSVFGDKMLKEEFKRLYRYMTIDDLISNTDIYNKEFEKDVISFYNKKFNTKNRTMTSDMLFIYYNEMLNKDGKLRTITIADSGEYVIIDLTHVKNMLNDSVNINEETKLDDIVKKEFIPKGTKLVFLDDEEWNKQMDKNVSGFFSRYRNDPESKMVIIDNTIYLPKSAIRNTSQDDLKITILHELQHAIQFANSLDAGMSVWFNNLSATDQKRILADFRKHTPELLKDLNDHDAYERIAMFGYRGTGETIAYGFGGNTTITDFVPIHTFRDDGINYVITPWGSKYVIHNYDVKQEDYGLEKNIEIEESHVPYIPVNLSLQGDKIRKPNKNELRENDPRAKDFISSERSPNAKYKERYYVLNDDGTQKLHSNGTPVYHYVYDTASDRTRGRYVGKRKYEGTNLEYFNKKYTPLQMTKEMQDFILNAKDLDPILQHKINGSKAGTLTERDVMDYFRSAEKIDDKTFKAINDAFFKNDRIKTFSDLESNTLKLPTAWAYVRLIRELPSMKKYSNLLTVEDFDLNLLVEAIEKNKDQSIAKKFSNYQTRYDMFNNRSIISSDEYVRTSLMNMYDGTLQSLWEVAAKTRYPAIHSYEITHKIELPKDFAEEAYSEMLQTVDITKPKIIEYLKKKYMTELYQKAVAEDSLDDAEVAHIFYLANELEDKLNGMNMSEIKNEYGDDQGVSKIIAEGIIAETTGKAVTIDEKLPEITSRELVSRIRSFIVTMRRNMTGNEIKNFVKEHSDIFEGNLKLKREVYQNLVPNKTQKGSHYRNKSVEEVQKLYDRIVELKNEVLENKRSSKESKKVAETFNKDQSRRIKELERELKELKASKEGKRLPTVTEFIVENEVIKVNTNVPMPDILKTVLQTQYDKTAKTDVKNLTSENERHVKMVSQSFYEQNAERLNTLTQGDIDNLVDFYLRANVSLNDVNAPYIATEIWMLTYLIRAGRKGNANFVIDGETLSKLESTLKTLQSTFGTGQVTWREALKKLNPEVIITQQMARQSGIEIEEADVESLLKAVESRDMKRVEKTKNDIYEKLLLQARKKKQDRKILDKILDKILQYERLAMLSGPGTWVRNWTSNQIITGSNKLTDGMSGKLEKILMKLFPKNQQIEGQYKIAGTKVSNEVADYISTNLLDNGLLDMVMESLMKYDVRKPRSGEPSVNVLTDLIANSVVSQFNSEHLSDNKTISKIEDFVRKMISDNKAVKKAAISYLGKMITEDLENGRIKSKTEVLSQNQISKNFLNYVAEAYKLATYDYMHKSNFFMQLESQLAKKSHGAYFAYKQLFPFAGASWNWFVEGLNYTPIGLAKSIVNFAKLEKTVEKMDKQRQTYANNDIGVSSDFAKYLTLRNINKGVIGSVGFLIGALLTGFGVARIDEEDDKYKIVIGDNVYIDISDLFGTQGIFFGMSIVGSISNKESVVDVFAAGLDQLFIDSTFADMFNNFRYSQSFGDWLMYQPYSMLNMMIPNFIKTITSMTPYEVNYSDGIKGKAEKLLVNAIPGISFAFPHYYDPYTGEKQVSQKLWALTKAVDKLSPLGLSIYNVSDLEKLAIEYGIHKSQLTGRYNINDTDIKLKSSQIEQLNVFYGQLNVASFKELQSGQVTYKIQQKDGGYKTKRWQQMTDTEKAAIVNRIMTNNSGYAKIYILTDSGKYRYYASESEYKELRSLGIYKNVYKATGKNKGFIEVN